MHIQFTLFVVVFHEGVHVENPDHRTRAAVRVYLDQAFKIKLIHKRNSHRLKNFVPYIHILARTFAVMNILCVFANRIPEASNNLETIKTYQCACVRRKNL